MSVIALSLILDSFVVSLFLSILNGQTSVAVTTVVVPPHCKLDLEIAQTSRATSELIVKKCLY